MRKTGDLSTPPQDRLVPIRDIAALLGNSESDVELLADRLGMVLEPLAWRGVQLTALTLSDTLALHRALRAQTEEGEEGNAEWRRSLDLAQEERRIAVARLVSVEEKLIRREREITVLVDRINDLELVVDGRDVLKDESEHLRNLLDLAAQTQEESEVAQDALRAKSLELERIYAESQAQVAAHANTLARQAKEHEQHRLAAKELLGQRMEEVENLSAQLRMADKRCEGWEHDFSTLQAEHLGVQEALKSRQEALEACRAEHAMEWQSRGQARHKSSQRMRRLRRTLEAAIRSERNLERYSSRLERKLLSRDADDWNPG